MLSYEIKDLTFSYPESDRTALSHFSLTVKQGEFFTICGKSGCGKSTLMRHLKTVLTPHGERSGEILFEGVPLSEVGFRTQSEKIGYVLQSPENQVVTDKVWHELAFGLESLGYEKSVIRLRVAEMASFFGIQKWFMKNVTELSGGQKQLLNLASVMAMQPDVLILDEPTSQLDPIAASEFLATVKKINTELGVTVIMTEHRLEEVFPMSDRIAVMDEGKLLVCDTPSKVGERLKEYGHDMFVSLPSAMQIYAGIDCHLPCPVTVKEGRQMLSELFADKEMKYRTIISQKKEKTGEIVISLKDVWFRYEKHGEDILKDLSLNIERGSLHAIVGGNGTGKTTALTVIGKMNKPYRGKVTINGKDLRKYTDQELFHENLAMLPQNPQALFVKKTVELDLLEMLSEEKISKQEKKERVLQIAQLAEISHLLEMHPYDLSGGEQQRAALAKVLLLKPKILLLDEPTKGIDNAFKNKLAQLLKKLNRQGVTVLMVSHDIEFCAKYADRCSMFFDGSVITTDTANRFFSGNSFYTTAANRMSRHLFENAVINEDVIYLCNLNLKKNSD